MSYYCYSGMQLKASGNIADYTYKIVAYTPEQNITVAQPFWSSGERKLPFDAQGKTQTHKIPCKKPEHTDKVKVVYYIYNKHYKKGEDFFARKEYVSFATESKWWPIYELPTTKGTTSEKRQNTEPAKITTDSVTILIGGPYYDEKGALARYGHTAIHLLSQKNNYNLVYDFGRYGDKWGTFMYYFETGHEGEGILRLWDNITPYIAAENALGRKTEGFTYLIKPEVSKKIKAFFDKKISGGIFAPKKEDQGFKRYRLKDDYHAFKFNCTTISMSGVKAGIPSFDKDALKYRKMRGLSENEIIAYNAHANANIGAWLQDICMPEDLKAFLNDRKDLRPASRVTYGKFVEKK